MATRVDSCGGSTRPYEDSGPAHHERGGQGTEAARLRPAATKGWGGSTNADVAVEGEEVVAAGGGVVEVGAEVLELGGGDVADGAEPVVDDLGLVVAEGVGDEFAFGDDADVDLDVAQAGLTHA